MKIFPLQETCKECPDCMGIMQLCEGTKREMTGNPEDDNTTIIRWWECLDCDYKGIAE